MYRKPRAQSRGEVLVGAVLLLVVILGLLAAVVQATRYVYELRTAEARAATVFEANHAFDRNVGRKLAAYNEALALSKAKNWPRPSWQMTVCEQQAMAVRDYAINVAQRSVGAPWPTSMAMDIDVVPPAAPYSAACQRERELVETARPASASAPARNS